MPNATDWAKARERFLKEAFPGKYKSMGAAGTLKAHLHEVGENAQDMYEDCQMQMMRSESLPQDYLQRVAKLERIPEILRELVMHEFITVPPESMPELLPGEMRRASNTVREETQTLAESSEVQVTAPRGSPEWFSQVEDRALDQALKRLLIDRRLEKSAQGAIADDSPKAFVVSPRADTDNPNAIHQAAKPK